MTTDMEELFAEPMADALGHLFAYAEEHQVQSVTLDVLHRKVMFAFASGPDSVDATSGADFYSVMREKYIDMNRAQRDFDAWFRSMLCAPKAMHYQQFVGEALTGLLQGDFFVSDKFITDDDRESVRSIFKELCVTDISLTNKCVVMLRCVRWEDGRFIFDDGRLLGMYMKEKGNELPPKAFVSFFRFVALCETAYSKQDSMAVSALKDSVDACLRGALEDIKSLRKHIRNMEYASYTKLWEYILYNNVSLAEKLLTVAPNGFDGGYNQKLICNIVGIMIDCGVFDLNKSQVNDLIYGKKNVKSYISNYASDGTDSVLTREETKYIKNIVGNNVFAK